MKLTVKTRGGKSPQGLPRVWYTGHPADLPVYADEIAADLYKTQDCAIYSDGEPGAAYDRDELLEQLAQMQLFVIPVTSRFLFQPNRARDLEFGYAAEHHIPVLPLLQEQGLENAFNKICGDLQILNKRDPDLTALPYDQKLERFLSSVLVGDELAAKIRAAFDAYVFLSYRKKDRKYAQELMRLIHKNEFCRDIAIWYDEFLTPGEDFNAAIAAALQKSSLFALAVTPHLTEPGNYVMTLEYPKARETGKPVLPVELVPTDREELAAGYPMLPEPTPAEDGPALSAALLDAVRRLAIKQNDTDPEHNFFIGLAYLGGVDVEVDRGRARELITGAAEAGLPEAMEKLVAMYRSGEGVARDYGAAVAWQQKLADLRQAQYEATGAELDGLVLMLALGDLAEYRKEQHNLVAAKRAYERVRDLCEAFVQEDGRVELKRMLASVYGELGEIHRAWNEYAEARQKYEQGLALTRQLCAEEDTIQNQMSFAAQCDNLGRLCLEKGDLAGARNYLEESCAICERNCEGTGDAYRRRSFAVACSHMGDLCVEEGRLAAAREQYERYLALTRQLLEESGSSETRRDFAFGCERMGYLCEKEGDNAAARGYYEQAAALRRQVFEELQTENDEMAYRNVSIQLANFYREECRRAIQAGDARQEEAWLRKILEVEKPVQAGDLYPPNRLHHAMGYSRLGKLCADRGDNKAAEENYLCAYGLLEKLFATYRKADVLNGMLSVLSRLGAMYRAQGRLDEAEERYLRCLELGRKYSGSKATVEPEKSCIIGLEGLCVIAHARKDMDDAKRYLLQSQAAIRQYFQRTRAGEIWQILLKKTDSVCCVCQEPEELAEAAGQIAQALEVWRAQWQETGSDQAARGLLEGWCAQGKALASHAKDEAWAVYDQAIRFAQELPEEKRVPELQDLIAEAHFGRARTLRGDAAAQKEDLTRALELWQRLQAASPDNAHYSACVGKTKWKLRRIERAGQAE